MKILVVFALISFNSFACRNKAPISAVMEYMNGPSPGVSCEQRPSDECLCFDHIEGWDVVDILDEMRDDPVWGPKENETSCPDIMSCEVYRETLCGGLGEGYLFFYAENTILPGYHAYCSKITGYNQVPTGKKVLVNSPAKKAAKESMLAIEAQKRALIESGKRAREACQRVLDLIGGFNLLPGRSSGQTDQMTTTFANAKAALQDGRPGKARYAIEQIPVDGILITQEMKNLALNELKDYEAVP